MSRSKTPAEKAPLATDMQADTSLRHYPGCEWICGTHGPGEVYYCGCLNPRPRGGRCTKCLAQIRPEETP